MRNYDRKTAEIDHKTLLMLGTVVLANYSEQVTVSDRIGPMRELGLQSTSYQLTVLLVLSNWHQSPTVPGRAIAQNPSRRPRLRSFPTLLRTWMQDRKLMSPGGLRSPLLTLMPHVLAGVPRCTARRPQQQPDRADAAFVDTAVSCHAASRATQWHHQPHARQNVYPSTISRQDHMRQRSSNYADFAMLTSVQRDKGGCQA